MFKNKLIAVINKDLEPGVAMNAMAHMALGFGATTLGSDLHLDNYQDLDGNIYPNISRMPFIILRGKSGEIKKVVKTAREHKDLVSLSVFTNTMTGGGYQEQLDRTLNTSTEDLILYGCILFGTYDVVHELTRKLSLYR